MGTKNIVLLSAVPAADDLCVFFFFVESSQQPDPVEPMSQGVEIMYELALMIML